MSKDKECKKGCFKTQIGGQALIEGVMMRGPEVAAMAVRLPNGEMDVEQWELKPAKWYNKTPLIRGPVNFVTSMVDGYKCLSKSADKSMQGIEEEPSKFEKWLTDKLGGKLMAIIMVVASVLGVALALGLFMWLPALITKGLSAILPDIMAMDIVKNLIEGILKILIFIGYIALTSLLKDIRRTYEYHGAEHKTIACYEAGEELTVENVKKHRRFHPRCGTSFMFLVLFISVLVNTVFRVPWGSLWVRVPIKLAVLPVVVAIAYEIIKLAGRYDNILTKIVSAPGLLIQRLTTREPDASQIECAIAAFMPCIPKEKGADKW